MRTQTAHVDTDCLQLEEDEIEYEQEQVRQAALHRLAWEADVQEKHRLQKMQAAKDKLAQDIMGRRAAEFARLKVSPVCTCVLAHCAVSCQRHLTHDSLVLLSAPSFLAAPLYFCTVVCKSQSGMSVSHPYSWAQSTGSRHWGLQGLPRRLEASRAVCWSAMPVPTQ